VETSNHFVRTDLLYEHLRASGVREVYAEFFIAFPLAFYDLESRHFRRIGTIETMPRPFDAVEHAAAIVWYRDGASGHDARAISTFQQFEIADSYAGPYIWGAETGGGAENTAGPDGAGISPAATTLP
jgi:hypothetical protein